MNGIECSGKTLVHLLPHARWCRCRHSARPTVRVGLAARANRDASYRCNVSGEEPRQRTISEAHIMRKANRLRPP